ncbi:MAG TPA: zincin-like metallopeptidase domain-containing protein [Syntrophorhabdus sp.]|nr:zincin-like metallopeptidase domain-containing protein [Syntrophorhabdus sp.]
MANVFEIVTEQILSHLDKGVIPWRKPWTSKVRFPRNLVTGKPYQGINIWLLLASSYDSPYWVTFNQVKALKGSIKKGEKSSIVVFWNFKEVNDLNEKTGEMEQKNIPFLKYYRVFNVLQCEDITYPDQSEEIHIDPITEAEALIDGYKDRPEIKHGFVHACYHPVEDLIKMPNRSAFVNQQEYFSTLFHEAIHSTGAPARLNRETLSKPAAFGSKDYAREELIAEMGAAYLCAVSGISHATVENSAAYIQGWRDSIRKDSRLVVMAAAQAQKAASYIMGKQEDEAEEKECG